MEKIYLIYQCDNWHTNDSMRLQAVATTMDNVIDLCKQIAKSEKQTLSADSLYNLEHILQTQEYEGIGEFFITEINTINKLL